MRRRLLVSLVAIAILAIAAFALPLAINERARIRSESDAALARDVDRVAVIAPADVIGRPGALRLERLDSTSAIGLYDLAGGRVAGTGPATADAPVRAALLDGEQHIDDVGGSRVAAEPVLDRGRVTGAVRLAVAQRSIESRVNARMAVLAARAVAVVLAAVVLAAFAARRLVRPVTALREGALQIGDGDFTVRVPTSGIAEMDEAGEALNAAAARIGDLIERERAFSADVSHQLRAPITGLRTLLESELLAPREEREVVLHEALASLDELEATVTSLLALTRDLPLDRKTLDVASVINSVALRWRDRVESAGRRLDVAIDAPYEHPAQVSSSALQHIVTVLIENALVHGAGTITVNVAASPDDAVVVTVQDEGHGVRDTEAVFARRSDAQRRSSAGGHGIGLALAATLAHAEGGRLSLDAPGPRPRFRLLLPPRRPTADEARDPQRGDPGDGAATRRRADRRRV